jgi:mycothiol synthase
METIARNIRTQHLNQRASKPLLFKEFDNPFTCLDPIATALFWPVIWPNSRHPVSSPAVGLLSNLLGLRHDRADDAPLLIRPASPAETEPAMLLVLAPPGGTADLRATQEFIAFARERDIGFDALHVALRDGKIVSAIFPVISPGRTMLMLCPSGGANKWSDPATRQLIDPVCAFCAQRGIHLAQTLIDPRDTVLENIFLEQRFDRMAELHYLQVQVPADSTIPPLPAGMSWLSYSPQRHGLFGQTILETYKNSLDCPALNGRRDIEDVMAGHKASGIFNPDLWLLLQEGSTTLGVLLLSKSLRSDSIELVYLGLTPAGRGRKLAELMMQQAFALVIAQHEPKLCLAVDALNTPALKLYYRHGMHRIASKIALLRDLREVG